MAIKKVLFVGTPAFSLYSPQPGQALINHVSGFGQEILQLVGDEKELPRDATLPAVLLHSDCYDSVRTAQVLSTLRFKMISSLANLFNNVNEDNAESQARYLREKLDAIAIEDESIETAVVVLDPVGVLYLYRSYCELVGLTPEFHLEIGIQSFPVCAYRVNHSESSSAVFRGTATLLSGQTYMPIPKR